MTSKEIGKNLAHCHIKIHQKRDTLLSVLKYFSKETIFYSSAPLVILIVLCDLYEDINIYSTIFLCFLILFLLLCISFTLFLYLKNRKNWVNYSKGAILKYHIQLLIYLLSFAFIFKGIEMVRNHHSILSSNIDLLK